MGMLYRQTRSLLWIVAAICPLFGLIECIDGSVGERNKFLRANLPSTYHLRALNQYQDCVDDLYASDLNDDLKIGEEEYVTFIATRSQGAIDVDDYSSLPFPLISNFVFGSCFCSFVLKIPNCCVGPDAGIGIDPAQSPFVEDNLITICRTADDVIRSEIGSLNPSGSPTLEPSMQITEEPSGFPTTSDSETPSSIPTKQITVTPTSTPSIVPIVDLSSSTPTALPSSNPTIMPTIIATSVLTNATDLSPDDLLCLNFQYGIKNNKGLSSDDIENEFNNTFKSDLIIATRDITIKVLNETFPRDAEERALRRDTADHSRIKTYEDIQLLGVVNLGRFELYDDEFEHHTGSNIGQDEKIQGQRRAVFLPSINEKQEGIVKRTNDNTKSMDRKRRLAFYVDSYPPVISSIFDNPFCPVSDDELVSCSIVDTRVCVILEDGDDEKEVKDFLLDGIKTSFLDGSFQNAIPKIDEFD